MYKLEKDAMAKDSILRHSLGLPLCLQIYCLFPEGHSWVLFLFCQKDLETFCSSVKLTIQGAYKSYLFNRFTHGQHLWKLCVAVRSALQHLTFLHPQPPQKTAALSLSFCQCSKVAVSRYGHSKLPIVIFSRLIVKVRVILVHFIGFIAPVGKFILYLTCPCYVNVWHR